MPKARTAGAVGGLTRRDDFDAPGAMPVAAWQYVLRRVGRRVLVDRILLLSAGIAFFAMLSMHQFS